MPAPARPDPDRYPSASSTDNHVGDNLVFSESGFAHGDRRREENQYVGRSLKVNGSIKRDAYTDYGQKQT